ncbi:Peroxisomal biogenesis protein (peroxin) [Handroanthus impetiginosus]|uniref:Peroxisomal biogenesis protein (Peroxin) n=1 Tax=Handroanthus impetiginosus TaxID=429701 RepID=A0A2G9GD11_9LAMI|nr:Peroxisomal biogenesis protein (peroxin) [Handroanthus impetiginosus]
MASNSPDSDPKPQITNPPPKPTSKNKDFLTHLEIYLAKRDGVDKLLKISRYATKIILASSVLADEPLVTRLKSFESSVGVSRKALRLGKFIQDVNALRATQFSSHFHLNFVLSVIAYGGEGLYYFIEQFVWLGKAGLIDKRRLPALQKWSAWCEFVGYFGSVSLKVIELRKIDEEERCLLSSIDVTVLRGIECGKEQEKLRKLRGKKMMKRLSVVQDLADALMALADISDGRGRLSAPLLVSSAGLFSALISTHKNWVSC